MKTILVAEDREVSRELARTLLEHSGYAVLEARNGAEAVAMAQANLPDLVLLDLQMPIKNGLQGLQAPRSANPFNATPSVALTASAMMGDKDKALMAGFTAYLINPLFISAPRQE